MNQISQNHTILGEIPYWLGETIITKVNTHKREIPLILKAYAGIIVIR